MSTDSFASELPNALRTVENEDADADGQTNIDELRVGSDPANADSVLAATPQTGRYDPRFAFRRVSAHYCGHSPTYDELTAFHQLETDELRRAFVHDTLAARAT